MKYYARINKTQMGPLTLTELVNAGVRPSNYVWCKGMADWQRASEVPDICRAMRRALAGLDPATGEERRALQEEDVAPGKYDPANPPTDRREMLEYLRQAIDESQRAMRPDYSIPPQGVSVVMAIVLTICCFPITGMFAIYFAWRCRSFWKQSCEEGISAMQREDLRRRAHDDARLYRMMVGITFCIGIIMTAMTLARYLL